MIPNRSKLVLFALIGQFFVSGALSQTSDLKSKAAELPITGEEIFSKNRQLFMSTHPISLFGNIVNIYKVTGSVGTDVYNFIPYVQVDWRGLETEVAKKCSSSSARDQRQTVSAPVTFYRVPLLEELKRKIFENTGTSIEKLSITVPPNVGVVVAAFSGETPHELVNTIPLESLLRNVPLTDMSGAIPSEVRSNIRATCSELQAILEQKRVTALMFIVGAKAKVNQFTAAANILFKSNLLSDLKNAESQVDKTKVKSGGKGGSLGIKLGPVALAGGGQSTQTTTDRQHFRIINRAWLDSNIEKATTQIEFRDTCESQPCESKTAEKLYDLFFGKLEAYSVEIDTTRNDLWKAKYKGTELPVSVVKVDDEVKALLNNAFQAKESKEVEYKGMKAKRQSEIVSVIGSDTNWKRKGDEWVPTTMKAHVVNTAEIERELKATYTQTILGETSNAAISLPILSEPGLKPFPISAEMASKIEEIAKAPSPITARKPITYNQSQRVAGTEYPNVNDYPIAVLVGVNVSFNPGPQGPRPPFMCSGVLLVNGVPVATTTKSLGAQTTPCWVDAVVPPKSTYKFESYLPVMGWTEWR